MKKNRLSLCLVLCLACYNSFSQPCLVNITGTNCTGNTLTASFPSGSLAAITWKMNGSPVFLADTISSSTSIKLVAGGRGDGSAGNQFKFPTGGVAVDAQGNIYVADNGNNRVQKWAPGAVYGITVAGGHGAGPNANQLFHPKDVFVTANGDLYVADYGNNRIQKWTPGASEGITVAGGNGFGDAPSQLYGPSGVHVDNNGNIYVADTYNFRIQRWRAGANKGITVAGGSRGTGANQLIWPTDVCLDASNHIFIADADLENSDHHRVQMWTLGATSGITVAGGEGTGNGPNQFGYLLAIALDNDGNLYAADNGVSGVPAIGRVQKWTVGNRNGTTVAGGHLGGWDQISYPTGVAVAANGDIYVLDGASNPRVQRYIPSYNMVPTTYVPTQPGNYTVEATFKGGCMATSASYLVRATPPRQKIQTLRRGGRGNLCEGGVDTFYVQIWDDITAYSWTIPPQCTMLENKNDTIIISVPANFGSGRITVKGTNTCGTSIPDTMVIQGKPVPPYRVFGPLQVAANQQGVVYQVEDLGHVYNWSVPSGAVITGGQGTSAITVNWGTQPGYVGVSAGNNCGTSKNAQKMVQVATSIVGFGTNSESMLATSAVKISMMVSPNPVTSNATVTVQDAVSGNYRIELRDFSGKLTWKQERLLKQGTNSISLDMSNFSPCVYFLNLIGATKERASIKIVKQ